MFSSNTSQVSEDRLYVEDVFSTYLYAGNNSTQTITNGIDLSGKGGLVWIKSRSSNADHYLFDTDRGVNVEINSNTTDGNTTLSNSLTSFNSDGFSISNAFGFNQNSQLYASWTFRKAPKFFDVVTYTGNGANRNIAHNLGVAPGCIIVKRTDAAANWQVYHHSNANTEYMVLNLTDAKATGTTRWNSTTPTATEFTVGTDTTVNASGGTYVAYLFAHDTTSDGIIQCGSYTGNGSATGPTISLGWEPQWVMIKRAVGGTGNWQIIDNMRGMPVGSADAILQANLTNAETSVDYISPTPTGFQVVSTSSEVNTNTSTYIYIAIRRGPMRIPTSGTSVFSPVAYTATNVDNRLVDTGIVTDMVMARARAVTSTGSFYVADRLRGINSLGTAIKDAENTDPDSYMTPTVGYGNAFSAMNGFGVGNDTIRLLNSGTNTEIAYAFKRAPSFFDEVCYTGTVSARTLNHNLGVVPELMIVKSRSLNADWQVYSAALPNTQYLVLNSTAAKATGTDRWDSTSPTSTTFRIGTVSEVNFNGSGYVAYLFASCPGVSKVGSYTGNGSSQTINCGFAAGARFVLIKRTDSTGDWYVWDTARGIVAGNDPHLSLNTTAAEVTTDDSIDTDSSGFVVNQDAATNINVSSATYIYLAVA